MATEKPIIVTAGGGYTDIDGLACCAAYQNLLAVKTIQAAAILLGPLNESVTKTIKNWKYKLENRFTGSPNDFNYVLTDISNPHYFSEFVVPENIVELPNRLF